MYGPKIPTITTAQLGRLNELAEEMNALRNKIRGHDEASWDHSMKSSELGVLVRALEDERHKILNG